jgi:MFS family permease
VLESHILAANGGSFLFGISLAWSAPSGPKLLSEENSYVISKTEFSLAVSMLPLGAAMFCVISGLIRARWGTHLTVMVFTLPHIAGWVMITLAQNSMMVCGGSSESIQNSIESFCS